MISVCIATYNGENFIKRQLDSILPQLKATDEIIVVDDCSSDKTCTIIESYQSPIIKIHKNKTNIGYVRTFEKALSLATGDYIFLSDQDDQWFDTKVATVVPLLQQGAAVVYHDAVVINATEQKIADSWWEYAKLNPHQGYLSNFYLNAFTGCMIAMSKKMKEAMLPIPKNIEMHDQWLYLVAKKTKAKIMIVEQPLMYYARHGENASGTTRRSLKKILSGRFSALGAILSYRK